MTRFWERRLFVLPSAYARLLRLRPIGEELRRTLVSHGVPLGANSEAIRRHAFKWLISSQSHTFVLRLIDDSLVVAEDLLPALSLMLFFADRIFGWFRWTIPAATRRLRTVWGGALRKRLFERPGRLLVNVGAGAWHVPGWKVLDHYGAWYQSNRLLIDFEHDLSRQSPLPFADDSVELFYSEHVFEHLPDECCRYAFEEMHRSLIPGGGLRIVVPDADLLVERLRARDRAFFTRLVPDRPDCIEEQFLVLVAHPRSYVDIEELSTGLESLPRRAFLDKCKRGLRYDYALAGEHINWFNHEKLLAMLSDCGFRHVARSLPQQSRFREMRGPRFDTRPDYSLHVDAVK